MNWAIPKIKLSSPITPFRQLTFNMPTPDIKLKPISPLDLEAVSDIDVTTKETPNLISELSNLGNAESYLKRIFPYNSPSKVQDNNI